MLRQQFLLFYKRSSIEDFNSTFKMLSDNLFLVLSTQHKIVEHILVLAVLLHMRPTKEIEQHVQEKDGWNCGKKGHIACDY